MANWVDLLPDLWERISRCCIISDACVSPEYIRMQSVCKSWRSMLKRRMQRELPWLMMLPNKEEENEDPDARIFFSLSKQKMHTIPLPEMRGKRCCGSFQNGWLMTVDSNLDICLFHPWSKKIIHLPPQPAFKNRAFVNEEGQVDRPFSVEQMRDREIGRVALSDAANMMVVLYGLGNLDLCRVGDDAAAYTAVETDTWMEDVIYHKGHFYALSKLGSLYVLHIGEGFDPHVFQLTEELDFDDPLPYTLVGYLVPDILTDTMFAITRNGFGKSTIHFDVFAVSLEERAHDKTLKEFTKMKSLGDRAVFLGHNSPMVVRASQFPGFKGNRIYFTDCVRETYCLSPHGCRDLGVFSVEDGTIELLFADRMHPAFSPPIWIATPPYSSQVGFEGGKLCFEVEQLCLEEPQKE